MNVNRILVWVLSIWHHLILDLLDIKKPRSFIGKNPFSPTSDKSFILSEGIQAEDNNDIQFIEKSLLRSSLRTDEYKLIRYPGHDELYNIIKRSFGIRKSCE